MVQVLFHKCKESDVAGRINFNEARMSDRLARVAEVEVRTNEVIAGYTSYKIGGPATVWAAPKTEDGIGEVLAIVHSAGVPLFNGKKATALAGSPLLGLIRAAAEQGLGGMELMAGIPGGVGGALRMNAGAFGQEIEQTTVAVKGFRMDGTPFGATRKEINFNYRRVPELEQVVITSGQFRYKKKDAALLETRMNDILSLRAKKQPLNYPSCGSVFKRPAGYYAGALIEEAGLKGERIGGAMISPKHAGFILNVDNAKAVDIYRLIRRIEDRVNDRFGVKLQREVKLIGEFDD